MSHRQPVRTALAVAALVLATVSLVGCSAGTTIDLSTAKPIVPAPSSSGPSAAPSTVPSASPSPDESFVAADPATFATDSATQLEFLSPDANTRCVMYAADAGSSEASLWGCSLYSADWSESAKNCATLDCAVGVEARGDAAPAPRAHAGEWLWDATVATLPYGQSLTVDTTQCTSSEAGVTCADELSGHGFTVSRAAQSSW